MNDYEETKKAAVAALKLIDPKKPYNTELFNAIARVSVSVVIEAVCLRRNPNTGKIEAYLVQRALNDVAYPGEWHCPGSVMRPGESEKDIFERLYKREAKIQPIRFVENYNNPTEARGHFFSLIYLCRLESEGQGKWYPIDALPEKTVEHHREIIPIAVRNFVSHE